MSDEKRWQSGGYHKNENFAFKLRAPARLRPIVDDLMDGQRLPKEDEGTRKKRGCGTLRFPKSLIETTQTTPVAKDIRPRVIKPRTIAPSIPRDEAREWVNAMCPSINNITFQQGSGDAGRTLLNKKSALPPIRDPQSLGQRSSRQIQQDGNRLTIEDTLTQFQERHSSSFSRKDEITMIKRTEVTLRHEAKSVGQIDADFQKMLPFRTNIRAFDANKARMWVMAQFPKGLPDGLSTSDYVNLTEMLRQQAVDEDDQFMRNCESALLILQEAYNAEEQVGQSGLTLSTFDDYDDNPLKTTLSEDLAKFEKEVGSSKNTQRAHSHGRAESSMSSIPDVSKKFCFANPIVRPSCPPGAAKEYITGSTGSLRLRCYPLHPFPTQHTTMRRSRSRRSTLRDIKPIIQHNLGGSHLDHGATPTGRPLSRAKSLELKSSFECIHGDIGVKPKLPLKSRTTTLRSESLSIADEFMVASKQSRVNLNVGHHTHTKAFKSGNKARRIALKCSSAAYIAAVSAAYLTEALLRSRTLRSAMWACQEAKTYANEADLLCRFVADLIADRKKLQRNIQGARDFFTEVVSPKLQEASLQMMTEGDDLERLQNGLNELHNLPDRFHKVIPPICAHTTYDKMYIRDFLISVHYQLGQFSRRLSDARLAINSADLLSTEDLEHSNRESWSTRRHLRDAVNICTKIEQLLLEVSGHIGPETALRERLAMALIRVRAKQNACTFVQRFIERINGPRSSRTLENSLAEINKHLDGIEAITLEARNNFDYEAILSNDHSHDGHRHVPPSDVEWSRQYGFNIAMTRTFFAQIKPLAEDFCDEKNKKNIQALVSKAMVTTRKARAVAGKQEINERKQGVTVLSTQRALRLATFLEGCARIIESLIRITHDHPSETVIQKAYTRFNDTLQDAFDAMDEVEFSEKNKPVHHHHHSDSIEEVVAAHSCDEPVVSIGLTFNVVPMKEALRMVVADPSITMDAFPADRIVEVLENAILLQESLCSSSDERTLNSLVRDYGSKAVDMNPVEAYKLLIDGENAAKDIIKASKLSSSIHQKGSGFSLNSRKAQKQPKKGQVGGRKKEQESTNLSKSTKRFVLKTRNQWHAEQLELKKEEEEVKKMSRNKKATKLDHKTDFLAEVVRANNSTPLPEESKNYQENIDRAFPTFTTDTSTGRWSDKLVPREVKVVFSQPRKLPSRLRMASPICHSDSSSKVEQPIASRSASTGKLSVETEVSSNPPTSHASMLILTHYQHARKLFAQYFSENELPPSEAVDKKKFIKAPRHSSESKTTTPVLQAKPEPEIDEQPRPSFFEEIISESPAQMAQSIKIDTGTGGSSTQVDAAHYKEGGPGDARGKEGSTKFTPDDSEQDNKNIFTFHKKQKNLKKPSDNLLLWLGSQFASDPNLTEQEFMDDSMFDDHYSADELSATPAKSPLEKGVKGQDEEAAEVWISASGSQSEMATPLHEGPEKSEQFHITMDNQASTTATSHATLQYEASTRLQTPSGPRVLTMADIRSINQAKKEEAKRLLLSLHTETPERDDKLLNMMRDEEKDATESQRKIDKATSSRLRKSVFDGGRGRKNVRFPARTPFRGPLRVIKHDTKPYRSPYRRATADRKALAAIKSKSKFRLAKKSSLNLFIVKPLKKVESNGRIRLAASSTGATSERTADRGTNDKTVKPEITSTTEVTTANKSISSFGRSGRGSEGSDEEWLWEMRESIYEDVMNQGTPDSSDMRSQSPLPHQSVKMGKIQWTKFLKESPHKDLWTDQSEEFYADEDEGEDERKSDDTQQRDNFTKSRDATRKDTAYRTQQKKKITPMHFTTFEEEPDNDKRGSDAETQRPSKSSKSKTQRRPSAGEKRKRNKMGYDPKTPGPSTSRSFHPPQGKEAEEEDDDGKYESEEEKQRSASQSQPPMSAAERRMFNKFGYIPKGQGIKPSKSSIRGRRKDSDERESFATTQPGAKSRTRLNKAADKKRAMNKFGFAEAQGPMMATTPIDGEDGEEEEFESDGQARDVPKHRPRLPMPIKNKRRIDKRSSEPKTQGVSTHRSTFPPKEKRAANKLGYDPRTQGIRSKAPRFIHGEEEEGEGEEEDDDEYDEPQMKTVDLAAEAPGLPPSSKTLAPGGTENQEGGKKSKLSAKPLGPSKSRKFTPISVTDIGVEFDEGDLNGRDQGFPLSRGAAEQTGVEGPGTSARSQRPTSARGGPTPIAMMEQAGFYPPDMGGRSTSQSPHHSANRRALPGKGARAQGFSTTGGADPTGMEAQAEFDERGVPISKSPTPFYSADRRAGPGMSHRKTQGFSTRDDPNFPGMDGQSEFGGRGFSTSKSPTPLHSGDRRTRAGMGARKTQGFSTREYPTSIDGESEFDVRGYSISISPTPTHSAARQTRTQSLSMSEEPTFTGTDGQAEFDERSTSKTLTPFQSADKHVASGMSARSQGFRTTESSDFTGTDEQQSFDEHGFPIPKSSSVYSPDRHTGDGMGSRTQGVPTTEGSNFTGTDEKQSFDEHGFPIPKSPSHSADRRAGPGMGSRAQGIPASKSPTSTSMDEQQRFDERGFPIPKFPTKSKSPIRSPGRRARTQTLKDPNLTGIDEQAEFDEHGKTAIARGTGNFEAIDDNEPEARTEKQGVAVNTLSPNLGTDGRLTPVKTGTSPKKSVALAPTSINLLEQAELEKPGTGAKVTRQASSLFKPREHDKHTEGEKDKHTEGAAKSGKAHNKRAPKVPTSSNKDQPTELDKSDTSTKKQDDQTASEVPNDETSLDDSGASRKTQDKPRFEVPPVVVGPDEQVWVDEQTWIDSYKQAQEPITSTGDTTDGQAGPDQAGTDAKAHPMSSETTAPGHTSDEQAGLGEPSVGVRAQEPLSSPAHGIDGRKRPDQSGRGARAQDPMSSPAHGMDGRAAPDQAGRGARTKGPKSFRVKGIDGQAGPDQPGMGAREQGPMSSPAHLIDGQAEAYQPGTDTRAQAHGMDGRPGPDQYGREQYGTDQYGTDQYGTDQYGTDQYGTDQYGTDQYGTDQYGTDQYGTDQYGTVQYGTDKYARKHGPRAQGARAQSPMGARAQGPMSSPAHGMDGRPGPDQHSTDQYGTNARAPISSPAHGMDGRPRPDQYGTEQYAREQGPMSSPAHGIDGQAGAYQPGMGARAQGPMSSPAHGIDGQAGAYQPGMGARAQGPMSSPAHGMDGRAAHDQYGTDARAPISSPTHGIDGQAGAYQPGMGARAQGPMSSPAHGIDGQAGAYKPGTGERGQGPMPSPAHGMDGRAAHDQYGADPRAQDPMSAATSTAAYNTDGQSELGGPGARSSAYSIDGRPEHDQYGTDTRAQDSMSSETSTAAYITDGRTGFDPSRTITQGSITSGTPMSSETSTAAYSTDGRTGFDPSGTITQGSITSAIHISAATSTATHTTDGQAGPYQPGVSISSATTTSAHSTDGQVGFGEPGMGARAQDPMSSPAHGTEGQAGHDDLPTSTALTSGGTYKQAGSDKPGTGARKQGATGSRTPTPISGSDRRASKSGLGNKPAGSTRSRTITSVSDMERRKSKSRLGSRASILGTKPSGFTRSRTSTSIHGTDEKVDKLIMGDKAQPPMTAKGTTPTTFTDKQAGLDKHVTGGARAQDATSPMHDTDGQAGLDKSGAKFNAQNLPATGATTPMHSADAKAGLDKPGAKVRAQNQPATGATTPMHSRDGRPALDKPGAKMRPQDQPATGATTLVRDGDERARLDKADGGVEAQDLPPGSTQQGLPGSTNYMHGSTDGQPGLDSSGAKVRAPESEAASIMDGGTDGRPDKTGASAKSQGLPKKKNTASIRGGAGGKRKATKSQASSKFPLDRDNKDLNKVKSYARNGEYEVTLIEDDDDDFPRNVTGEQEKSRQEGSSTTGAASTGAPSQQRRSVRFEDDATTARTYPSASTNKGATPTTKSEAPSSYRGDSMLSSAETPTARTTTTSPKDALTAQSSKATTEAASAGGTRSQGRTKNQLDAKSGVRGLKSPTKRVEIDAKKDTSPGVLSKRVSVADTKIKPVTESDAVTKSEVKLDAVKTEAAVQQPKSETKATKQPDFGGKAESQPAVPGKKNQDGAPKKPKKAATKAKLSIAAKKVNKKKTKKSKESTIDSELGNQPDETGRGSKERVPRFNVNLDRGSGPVVEDQMPKRNARTRNVPRMRPTLKTKKESLKKDEAETPGQAKDSLINDENGVEKKRGKKSRKKENVPTEKTEILDKRIITDKDTFPMTTYYDPETNMLTYFNAALGSNVSLNMGEARKQAETNYADHEQIDPPELADHQILNILKAVNLCVYREQLKLQYAGVALQKPMMVMAPRVSEAEEKDYHYNVHHKPPMILSTTSHIGRQKKEFPQHLRRPLDRVFHGRLRARMHKFRNLLTNAEETHANKVVENDVAQEIEKAVAFRDQDTDVKTWCELRLALHTSLARYQVPMDFRKLEDLTPEDYIRNHTSISAARMSIYMKTFALFRSANDGGKMQSGNLARALAQVIVYDFPEEAYHEVIRLVHMQENLIDLKMFASLCALTERLLYPLIEEGSGNNILINRDPLEIADFAVLHRRVNEGLVVQEQLLELFYKIDGTPLARLGEDFCIGSKEDAPGFTRLSLNPVMT